MIVKLVTIMLRTVYPLILIAAALTSAIPLMIKAEIIMTAMKIAKILITSKILNRKGNLVDYISTNWNTNYSLLLKFKKHLETAVYLPKIEYLHIIYIRGPTHERIGPPFIPLLTRVTNTLRYWLVQ